MELFKDLENLQDPIFSIASKANTKEFHSHQVGQLSVPKNGMMYFTVEDRLYIIPPHMAIFIPKDIMHKVYKINATVIETIYFQENFFPSLPLIVKTFHLSELAKSLISNLCETKIIYDNKAINKLNVLLDELETNSDPLTYEVVMPKNEGLLKIFDYMMNAVDFLPGLEDCANLIKTSPRTLQRKLKQELNIHFALWRQQILFAKALALLAKYKRTSIVAYKLGYSSESAFIAMFKKISGQRLPSQF